MSWPDSRWETGLTPGPHLAVTWERGVTLSASAARREGARVGCWAALLGPKPGTGPRREEKGEGELAGCGGEKNGPSQRVGRERGKPFPFSNFIFCSNLLKRIFKTILN